MNKVRLKLIAALLFPIVVLAANAWMNQQQRDSGKEMTFPIQGFDPRDMLSGHYLVFEIDYSIDAGNGCPASDIVATLCLQPEKRVYPSDELPPKCSLYLQGHCNNQGQFSAGLERFYIPQEIASALEEKIRDGKAEVILSIDNNGHTVIRDLLIEKQSWKKMLQE